VSRFAHGVIAVADMDESCRFYRDGLGFEQISDDFIKADFERLIGVNAKGARSVMLADSRDPSSTPIVELLDFGGAAQRPSAHAGPLCIGAFAVSLWANADEIQERLKSHGYNPFVERAIVTAFGPPMEIGFVRDPDGTYIELLPPYPMPSEETGGADRMRSGPDHTAMAVTGTAVTPTSTSIALSVRTRASSSRS
jgi:catechol 2,3-dioxygenase-like lactoylglutathione lyase family enzyme